MDFATLAEPLNWLTSKEEEFVWREAQGSASSTLQTMMVEAQELAYLVSSTEHMLDTGAIADGAGGVLSLSQRRGGSGRLSRPLPRYA